MSIRPTTRVDDEAAVSPSDGEPPALDAQARDLPLLQQVLEAGEGLNAPHELAGIAVAAGAAFAAFAARLGEAAAEAAGRAAAMLQHTADAGCLPVSSKFNGVGTYCSLDIKSVLRRVKQVRSEAWWKHVYRTPDDVEGGRENRCAIEHITRLRFQELRDCHEIVPSEAGIVA